MQPIQQPWNNSYCILVYNYILYTAILVQICGLETVASDNIVLDCNLQEGVLKRQMFCEKFQSCIMNPNFLLIIEQKLRMTNKH